MLFGQPCQVLVLSGIYSYCAYIHTYLYFFIQTERGLNPLFLLLERYFLIIFFLHIRRNFFLYELKLYNTALRNHSRMLLLAGRIY